MSIDKQEKQNARPFALLVVGALGVVYGDLGTSPLYAIRECFQHVLEPTQANLYGVLSMVFWTMTLVISGKFAALILYADNKGEGGEMALMTLVLSSFKDRSTRGAKTVLVLGLFGTALLYGDSVITPAISVLSAVEGLEVLAPDLKTYILPVSAAILTMIFMVQRYGTGRIGAFNGPIMLLWFFTIGLLGLLGIAKHPGVLTAVNPLYAVNFWLDNGFVAFIILGSVVLAITGGEALYADLGHFGRKPIQAGWYFVAMPGLLLNYFGQVALLLTMPEARENPFYYLAPRWALLPMVFLATAATIIASQAMISGAFSLTRQAVLLGYLPRLKILHTSQHSIGQIYVPFLNWTLFVLTLGITLFFKESTKLAGAYGVAVTADNIISSILLLVLMRRVWKVPPALAYGAIGILLVSDFAYFGATALKIPYGGWFPLLLASLVFFVMMTWIRGRALVGERFKAQRVPLSVFLMSLNHSKEVIRVPLTAVFLSGNWETTPVALLHNIKHNQVLHEKVVLLSIRFEEESYVRPEDRLEICELEHGFYGVKARYGFMESPSIKDLYEPCREHGLNLDAISVGYFLGRENIRISKQPGLPRLQRVLFSFMARNAEGVGAFLEIPANQVVELGVFVEL